MSEANSRNVEQIILPPENREKTKGIKYYNNGTT